MISVEDVKQNDDYFMTLALEEATKAEALGEVPIGAIVVKDGVIIGRGYNYREIGKDPTAHAEMIALKNAAQTLGGWRLTGCDLYVTIEPCAMCTGAIIQSRIQRLVIGAMDFKAGACGGATDLIHLSYHNHTVDVLTGVLEEICSTRMKTFFKALRTK
jgi:tRNA(adenine34) deaminase